MLHLALPALLALAGSPQGAEPAHHPGDGWQKYTSIDEAGFDSERFPDLDYARAISGASSALVIHDGAVVHSYGDVTQRFMCHSIRKSLMSALIGIFVEQEVIDLKSTLDELGIDDIAPSLTKRERKARIVDLLKSRSGVYHLSAYETPQMKTGRPKRGSHSAGKHWWYNNWDFNALLSIFEQETGELFFEAFQQRLATPIGMEDFRLRDGYYHKEPKNSMHSAYPFQLSARDLARLGVLMANEGQWGETQVVPAEWIEESTRAHSEIDSWQDFDGYGYLWWIGEVDGHRVFSAQGNGGNSMDVFPDLDLVIVFRADTYADGSIDWAIRRHIVEGILKARNGRSKENAELRPLLIDQPQPTAVPLTSTFLKELPLELQRLPPPNGNVELPAVRLELLEDTLVVRIGLPSAPTLDLVPIGIDRFWIADAARYAAIERDKNGKPFRFVLQGERIARAGAFFAKGLEKEADQERMQARALFPPPEVDESVTNAQLIHECVQRLLELQEENGSWPYEGRYRVVTGAALGVPITYQIGGTAIAGLALLHGKDDDDLHAQSALDEGLDFILDHWDDEGMSAERADGYDMRVLGQAYSLLFLCHARDVGVPSDKKRRINKAIKGLTKALLHEQLPDGGWNYQGRPVHASFVTASVVQSLLWARSQNEKVSLKTLDRAGEALILSRFLDGGFRYFGTERSHPKRVAQDLLPGSIGRSPLCETVLYQLGESSPDNIRQMLAAFHKYWEQLEVRRARTGTHEGPFLIAPYYFIYGHRYAAQASLLLPEAERATEESRIRTLLLNTRDKDGTWNDREFSRAKSYGTSMVILTLLKEVVPLPPALER